MPHGNALAKAFQRGRTLDASRWHKGILTTYLAEATETNGAYDLCETTMAPGMEPPPHVHSREDELFYVLDGEFDAYVGDAGFAVRTGECAFLPRHIPHAWIIRSPRLHMLSLITPGGFLEAIRDMSAPAQRLDLPAEALTYATADLERTMQVLSEYGIRMLSPEETSEQLPLYPHPLRPSPVT
jgi:mannose-6-phosphate isomerase-like protein (cupin superfamily)